MKKFKGLDEQQRVYASVIAEGDEAVGRILSLVKELGIDEKTLIVFTTDNGAEFTKDKKQKFNNGQDLSEGYGGYYSVGESGGLKGKKRSLFAGGIRVPFIVRWPGVVPAGKVDKDSVVTAVDLLPTFLDVAGVPLPEGYKPDGESALSAFKGESFTRTQPIYWEWRGGDNQDYTWPSSAVRDGKWKLLVNKERKLVELYDLENDWAEKTDVASKYPEVVQKLSDQLQNWQSSLPLKPSPNAFSKGRKKKNEK